MVKVRERNIGWRIDYFIVSNRLHSKLIGADIYDQVLGSNHYLIELKIEL